MAWNSLLDFIWDPTSSTDCFRHLLKTYLFVCYCCTHTHTHPFNSPFYGTTQVSRYQKDKTNLDLTEARDSEWQWHQLGYMQVCTLLQTDNQHPTTPFFYRPDALPAAQPTASKHWRHSTEGITAASSALGVLNDYALYKSTQSSTHSDWLGPAWIWHHGKYSDWLTRGQH